MEKIYSRISPGILCHQILRLKDYEGRKDLVSPEQSLQIAALKCKSGDTFKPHVHNFQPRITNSSQEAWVIVKGHVRAFYFDIDKLPLGHFDLSPGDVSISLCGGHTYEMLEDSLIIEAKSGPYLGQAADKTQF